MQMASRHMKTFSVTNSQRNANQSYSQVPSPIMAEWLTSKTEQIANVGESVEKREPSYTVGGNVSWGSHYGKQYGGSSENSWDHHMIQQSPS